MYLDVNNLAKDPGSESNVRLAAVVNEMEDISGRQPIISSSDDALLSILPELPGVDLNQALVDGYGETCDFAYSVTLNTGQTVLFHGSISLPEHASEAPIQDIRLMMDKAAKSESRVSELLHVMNQRIFQHFSGAIALDCFALSIDTLNHRVDLGIAGFDAALAARLSEDSFLNLIGSGGPSLGEQPNAFESYDSLSFELQAEDAILLYTRGLCGHAEEQARLCAAFAHSMVLNELKDPQETVDYMTQELSDSAGGVLLMVSINEVEDF